MDAVYFFGHYLEGHFEQRGEKMTKPKYAQHHYMHLAESFSYVVLNLS